MKLRMTILALGLVLCISSLVSSEEMYNLKVVTDANPDYHDLPSLVHSATSRWAADKDRCWAMFYWNHIARRQTQPIQVHGMSLTDPIRQFNDYGYTMCSTISGINQSIWEAMGLKHKYWDISNHTVSEVEYDGRYHCYDSSLSATYTLCDGTTIAGVEDIGKDGACAASDGKTEPGHIAKYHCLNATSTKGFLIGADCMRSLDEEYRCFNPKGLKYRYYYYDWDNGHRYILNLKTGQTYTRHYTAQGQGAEFFIPNHGKDPELVNPRYRIRGNGVWTWSPSLLPGSLHQSDNIKAGGSKGLSAAGVGGPGAAVFRLNGANVITGLKVKSGFRNIEEGKPVSIEISITNGLHWTKVWESAAGGEAGADLKLIKEVNGAYEVLVRIILQGKAVCTDLNFEIITAINSKTQPRLRLGRNTVYVGRGDQTDSVVLWPELQNGEYKKMIVDEKNITCAGKHASYMGVLHLTKGNQEGYITYRIDAPRDITKLTYGGRFYNRAKDSKTEIMHSTDGKTWQTTWTLTDLKAPWDTIHYETVDIPAGHTSVWVKYRLYSYGAATSACSIYAVRMEAAYKPAKAGRRPLAVTFKWKEMQADRSLVSRGHTQLVNSFPFAYKLNTGGTDHPVMASLTVSMPSDPGSVRPGYSDGSDAGGKKFMDRWVAYGRNLAVGKAYTLSEPSMKNWGAGDPEGTKLTDGVVGPSYSGGLSYKYGAIWTSGKNPVISLDLGASQACAAFGLNIHGYPGWDALKGEVKDRIEVLISDDGKAYTSIGFLKTDLRWAELPANHMWTDEETMKGFTARLIPEKPVSTRYVQFRIANKRFLDVTEIEVLDSIAYSPFDLKVALPADAPPVK